MITSRSTVWTLVSLAIVAGALALVASGCSVKGAIIGSASTDSSSTSTTAAATNGPTSTGGSTGSTLRMREGKTAEEYAAELPELQKAVDANPNDLTALQALAVAQYNANKYDEAAATYLRMLQIQEDPMTRNNYANVLRDAGKIDQAAAEYEKAIAADPTLTVAYLNLAMMYVNTGKVAQANQVLDRGISATSGDDQTRLKTYKDHVNTPTTT